MTKQKIDGILLLDKPLHCSSNQALQKAKRLFNAKKAGHTGSLDVLASGMLPICFGEATKFSQYLLNANKIYETSAVLGQKSETGDAEGEIICERPVPDLTRELLETILAPFRGETWQTPSMYSALKHEGQPLYKLARQGITVERKPRLIRVDELILQDFSNQSLTLRVACSKGTYIRNLVEDIGEALGCGAYVSQLHRVQVADFKADAMLSLSTLEAYSQTEKAACLLPMDRALSHFPSLNLPLNQVIDLTQGKRLCAEDLAEVALAQTQPHIFRLYDAEKQAFFGLVSWDENLQCLKALRLIQTP
jgi:tRNA pseudouridine55 synthase